MIVFCLFFYRLTPDGQLYNGCAAMSKELFDRLYPDGWYHTGFEETRWDGTADGPSHGLNG